MASSLNALILCTTPLGMKISPSSGVYIFVSDPSVTSILPLMTWWISSWVSCQCGGTLNAMSSAVEFNWEAIIWTRTTQSLSFRKVCERRAQWHVCQCRYQFRWTWTYHRDAICEGYSWGKSISFGCHTEVRWEAGLNLQCNLHYQDEEFIYHYYITHGRMSEFHVWALRNQPAAQRTLALRKMGTHQKTPLCTIVDAADRAPERLPQLIPSVGMSIRPITSSLLFQLQCCVSPIQQRRWSESPKSILVAEYSCWDLKFRKIIFLSFLRRFQCWVSGAILDIQSWNPSAKLNINMSRENAVWTTIPTSHL